MEAKAGIGLFTNVGGIGKLSWEFNFFQDRGRLTEMIGGDPNRKNTTLLKLAFDGDLSPVGQYNMFDDGQTEPGSA